jgi:hypothetical protein
MDRNDPTSLKSTLSHKLYHRWIAIISILLLWAMFAAACGLNSPPSKSIQQVSESDLVGIWEIHYSRYDGVEFLVIEEGGTYQQIFEDAGYLYVSGIHKWHLDPSASGRLFVRFEKGRYYPEGPNFADLLGTDPLDHSRLYDFYDPEDSSSVYMDNELILEVFPSHNSKGITLGQFPSDIDAGREYYSPVVP